MKKQTYDLIVFLKAGGPRPGAMGNRRRNAAEARGPVLELERRGAGVRRRGCSALGRELAAAPLTELGRGQTGRRPLLVRDTF